jgi:hypothetical protein
MSCLLPPRWHRQGVEASAVFGATTPSVPTCMVRKPAMLRRCQPVASTKRIAIPLANRGGAPHTGSMIQGLGGLSCFCDSGTSSISPTLTRPFFQTMSSNAQYFFGSVREASYMDLRLTPPTEPNN